jgi:hypothetical protein
MHIACCANRTYMYIYTRSIDKHNRTFCLWVIYPRTEKVLKSKIKLDLGLYIISKDLLKGKRYVNTEVQTSAKINGPQHLGTGH